jgi:hypothetical protein
LLFKVLAPPSKFAVRAIPAIRALIEAAIGGLGYIHVTTIDQFRADWHHRKAPAEPLDNEFATDSIDDADDDLADLRRMAFYVGVVVKIARV